MPQGRWLHFSLAYLAIQRCRWLQFSLQYPAIPRGRWLQFVLFTSMPSYTATLMASILLFTSIPSYHNVDGFSFYFSLQYPAISRGQDMYAWCCQQAGRLATSRKGSIKWYFVVLYWLHFVLFTSISIYTRAAQTTAALTRLEPVWNDRSISLSSKIRLMRSPVTSIFLYACESWTLTAELQRRIQAMEMRCNRKILHISYKDHVTKSSVVDWA